MMSSKKVRLLLLFTLGLIFTFSFGISTEAGNSFSYTHRLVRDINSLLPERGYLPLEFKSSSPETLAIPNWPNLDELREKTVSFSEETKTLLVLPYLVDSLNVPDDFGYSLHLIYPLAYLRSLPYQTRQQILSELGRFNSDLSNFLRDNFRKSLDRQLTQIRKYFGQTYSDKTINKDIIPYIETRDRIVSSSRALRIGLEAIGGNQEVLDTIINNPNIAQVVFGLKEASVIDASKIGDLDKLEKALWAYRQVEGSIINIVTLNNGNFYIYNEYALRRKAVEKGRVTDITKLEKWTTEHLEEMIENDMEKKNGIFYDLTHQKVKSSLISQFAPQIVKATGKFTEFDPGAKNKIYRAGNLANQVFELEKTEPDTVFIATINRHEALRKQLEAELANYEIFNHRAPIVVIDDSWDGPETNDALSENKKTIKRLEKNYGAQIIHVAKGTSIGSPKKLVEKYAKDLAKKYNSGEIKMDEAVRKILKEKGILRNGKVKSSKLSEYLDSNMFEHISGVRNHMLLLAKGDNVIMNFDDDAPPETYTYKSQRTNKEIQKKVEQYIFNKFGIKITHQRYESLMDLHPEMLLISDFLYEEGLTREQIEEKEGFRILPVNTFSQYKLLNKEVKDTDLPVRKDDLRGTMGVPANYNELKDKRIVYVAFPFVGDQDTSALAQLLRYLGQNNLRSVNLQHTHRFALLNEENHGGVMGFAGETYNIFNRAMLWVGNGEIFPSIGRELRLEEPPYVRWIISPAMEDKVLTSYAKVGGGQIREIGERAYVIAGQDITEVIGGEARGFYELAVRKFREFLSKSSHLKGKGKEMERLQELGKNFIEVAEELKRVIEPYKDESGRLRGLTPREVEELKNKLRQKGISINSLLEHQEIRARAMADLGRRRGEKGSRLKATNQEVKDIDGALVEWAKEFELFNVDPDKYEAGQIVPEDKEKDYFYKIWRKDGKLKCQRIIPNIRIERKKGVKTVTKSKWKKVKRKKIITMNIPPKIGQEETTLQKGSQLYKFEIEPGRTIIMDKLPEEGKYAIVPALVDSFENEYLIKIVDRIVSSIISDGETMILWPDVVEVAEYWRDR